MKQMSTDNNGAIHAKITKWFALNGNDNNSGIEAEICCFRKMQTILFQTIFIFDLKKHKEQTGTKIKFTHYLANKLHIKMKQDFQTNIISKNVLLLSICCMVEYLNYALISRQLLIKWNLYKFT